MLDLGFDTTSNSVIISQSTEREDIVCKENFKNNWLQEYFDKNYIEEDVMVSHCFQYTYPIILNSDKEADVSRWGSAQMIGLSPSRNEASDIHTYAINQCKTGRDYYIRN